jgi:hypothetical protein
MDSTTTSLFTLAELKTTLNIYTTVTAYDLELGLLVDHVPAMFEAYLNRGIGHYERSETVIIDNDCSPDIYVKNHPISSVTSVAVEGDTTSYYTQLSAEHIELDEDYLTLAAGEQVVVTYVGGLDVSNPIFKYIALEQAKYLYQRHQHQHIHIDQNIQQQGRIIYKNESLLPIVKMVLDPYVKRI